MEGMSGRERVMSRQVRDQKSELLFASFTPGLFNLVFHSCPSWKQIVMYMMPIILYRGVFLVQS
jgi:hypothetical protein